MAQNKDTVRGLSRSYAAGDIDRDAYRLLRRQLIGGIVDDELELVPYAVPAPEAPTVFPYEDDDGDTTQEIIPPVAADNPAGTAPGGGAPFSGVPAATLPAIGIRVGPEGSRSAKRTA